VLGVHGSIQTFAIVVVVDDVIVLATILLHARLMYTKKTGELE
jgi:hypothetical protein